MASPPSPRSLLGLAALVLAISTGAGWWRGQAEQTLARDIAAAARPGDIEMLSSDSCVFCARARAWLQGHEVPFTECSIERDADCARRYRALAAPGTPTMLIRGQPQLGFDPERVRARLAAR
jgi:glutaredoxin